MLARGLGAALLVSAAIVAACAPGVGQGDGPLPVPSEAEARVYFGRLVELAMRGDFEGFCALGDPNCRGTLQDTGLDAVPTVPPLIVGTRVIQPRQQGDTWSSGGFVLQVCGIDGRGDPYFDEVLVFNDGSRLISIATVYWSNTLIADDSVVGGPPVAPPAACPA